MRLPVLKFLLAVTDVAVLGLVVSLLASNFRSRQHGARSWATTFHILVLLWLILRAVFWIMTITSGEHWHGDTFYLLYWLPNPLQFGSFSLLPLFYSQVLSSKREWRARSRIITPVYITLVSGMLVYMVGWTIWTAIQERQEFEASHGQCATAAPNRKPTRDCYEMEFASETFRVLTAVCFFALAAVVAAYGVKMSKLTLSQNRLYLIYHPRALAALNCFLFTVFLSKGAYQISSVMGLWYLPDVPLQGSKDLCLLNFGVFFYWDYIPTVWLLLVMTGSNGNTVGDNVKAVFPSRALNIGDTRNLPDYGLFREIKAAAAAEEAAQAEARNSIGYRPFQRGVQYSPGQGAEPSPVANSWFRDSSQTNNPYGSRSHSQSSAFGNNSVYTSGGDSMPYGDGGCGSGHGSTGGSVGMHAGSTGCSSVGSGLDSAAFAFAPSPSAPTHPHDRRRRTVGWFPWQNSVSTATASAPTWAGFGVRAEQPGGSGGDAGDGSRSNGLNRSATNTGTDRRGAPRDSSDKRESRGSVGESLFGWWRGVWGRRGGGSAVPSSGSHGEASTLINSSLGSLSRMGGAWQGEATYPLRGYGRGPGKAGVLLGEEEFERGAYDTGETFLPSTGPQHRREEEEACGQAVLAAIRDTGATPKGPPWHQHRRGHSGDCVRSGVMGSHPVVEESPVSGPADYQARERWWSGNETFAYDQRRRYSAPTPPSVQRRGPVETTASAPPLDATRQDSSLMARRDPSLIAQGHRHGRFSTGNPNIYTYDDIYRGDHTRGRDLGSEVARGSSSRDGGCSTHQRPSMGGKGVGGREKWPSVVGEERPVGNGEERPVGIAEERPPRRVEEPVCEQEQRPPYYVPDPC